MIKITHNKEENRWEARFPYDRDNIAKVKTARFRWQPDGKFWWTDDPSKLQVLKELIDPPKVSVDLTQKDTELVNVPFPEGIQPRDYQLTGISFLIKRDKVLLADDMGLGKEQPVNTPILTTNGWTTMGKLSIGDYVFGYDGNPTMVTGVYPQGDKDVYRVTLKDGSYTECGAEHLWTYRDSNFKRDGWKTSDTLHLMHKKGTVFLPLQKAVNLPDIELDIHPYLLGVFIGDGYAGSSAWISVSKRDDGILSEIKKHTTITSSSIAQCPQYLCSGLITKLKDIGLNVKSVNKFIPKRYMSSGTEQRKELLHGLMDSDGSCVKNRTSFHTRSMRLATDVQRLVFSLGGSAKIAKYKRDSGTDIVVNVKTTFNPFKACCFKRDRWKLPANAQGPKRTISAIEKTGKKKQCLCISVAAKDNLYLTSEFLIPTHNTFQAIGVFNKLLPKRTLVLCPASLCLNWKREFTKFGVDVPEIQVVKKTKDTIIQEGIVILNFEKLAKMHSQLVPDWWDLVIVDESHRLKNHKAAVTKHFYGKYNKDLKKRILPISKRKLLLLTGTPMLSRPAELWTTVKECDPAGLGADWNHFHSRYCNKRMTKWGWDISGASNLEELGQKLAKFSIRRVKDEVLAELPEATHQIIPLEPTPDQKELIFQEMEAINMNTLDVNNPKLSMDLNVIAKVRQEIALSKLPSLFDMIDEYISSGTKLVVAAHHRAMVEKIHEKYKELSVYLYGGMSNKDKQNSVDRFQDDDSIKLFIGSIQAAGTGITLTAASDMVFAENSWTPGEMGQMADRIRRIGQKNACNYKYPVISGSLDEVLLKKWMAKKKVINKVFN